jgi:hypothetical protein
LFFSLLTISFVLFKTYHGGKNGNECGIMNRRHIKGGKITPIGKETRNIENQSLGISPIEEYFDDTNA